MHQPGSIRSSLENPRQKLCQGCSIAGSVCVPVRVPTCPGAYVSVYICVRVCVTMYVCASLGTLLPTAIVCSGTGRYSSRRALSMVVVVVLLLELAFPFSLSSSTSIRIDTWLRCVVQETSQTLLLRLVRFSNTIYVELFVTVPRVSSFSGFRLLLANQKVHFLCIFLLSFFSFSFSFSSCSFFFLSAFFLFPFI